MTHQLVRTDASTFQEDAPTRDLFDPGNPYFPPTHPGETLYSWCARFHRISGQVRARQTSRNLFEDPSAGLRHDFPTHLDRFSSITSHHLGPVEQLVRERTLFGFHRPFLTDQRGQQVIVAMRSGSSPGPKSILGLAASRLGVTMPLKACPECMLEDKRKDLVAWWHLEHQWPSVRVCLRHAQLLLVAQDELHVRTLKDWWLPEDLDNRHWWTASQVGKEQLQELIRIAEWTAFLLKQDHSYFEQDLLRYAYLLRAQQRSWIAMDGSVRLQALKHAFARSYQGFAQLPGLSFLGTITDVNAGILGLLLRQFPSARHPVKHIYLMAFLFEEPAEFLELYRHVKAMAKSGGTTLLDEQLRDQIAQLRRMIVEEGRSVNAAASELGVTPTQAIRHLDSEGIPYKKRPRVLSPTIEKKLQVLLKAGKERQEISSALGIRMGFIKDYLARQPELKSAWTRAWHGRRKKEYRRCFLGVLRDNPGVPMKQIKRINGNGFQWLYRNDREWLTANLPTVR